MIACQPSPTHEVQSRFALESSEVDALVNQALPPAINWPALIDRCFGNVEFAIEVLKVFESTGQARSGEIERSVAAADFDRIMRDAHSLAGVAGMLDAERLCDFARQLDASARARDLARATQLAVQLQSELQRCLSEIPDLCARSASN
jgi:Amt family ammonium transporter